MKNDLRVAGLFIIINFFVSYVSDNVLNDLSKYTPYKILTSLAPYFKNKSIVVAGIYAGMTVVFATILLLLFNRLFLNTYLPESRAEFITTIVTAYVIGYALDVFICKMNIFDNLQLFYKTVGAGNGGALSFIFSLTISFIVLKLIFFLVEAKKS
jgi:hypothetical protein